MKGLEDSGTLKNGDLPANKVNSFVQWSTITTNVDVPETTTDGPSDFMNAVNGNAPSRLMNNGSTQGITSQHNFIQRIILEPWSPCPPAQADDGGGLRNYNAVDAFATPLRDSHFLPDSFLNYVEYTNTNFVNSIVSNALGTQTPIQLSPLSDYPVHSLNFPRRIPLEKRRPQPVYNFMAMSPRQNMQEQRSKPLSTNNAVNPSCTCQRSKCSKLYCRCFHSRAFCGESCACVNCSNNMDNHDGVDKSREQILSRNPQAFEPELVYLQDTNNSEDKPIPTRHKKGCKCKKSKCVKKYCECYQANVGCSEGCHCQDCKNLLGPKPAPVYRKADDEHLVGLNGANRQTAISYRVTPQTNQITPEYGSNKMRGDSVHMSLEDQSSFHNSDNHVHLPGHHSRSQPNVPVFGALQQYRAQQNASSKLTFDYATTSVNAFPPGHNSSDPGSQACTPFSSSNGSGNGQAYVSSSPESLYPHKSDAPVYRKADDEHLVGLNGANRQTAISYRVTPQTNQITPEYGSNKMRGDSVHMSLEDQSSFHNSDNHVHLPGHHSRSQPNVPVFGALQQYRAQQNASSKLTFDYATTSVNAFPPGHNSSDPGSQACTPFSSSNGSGNGQAYVSSSPESLYPHKSDGPRDSYKYL